MKNSKLFMGAYYPKRRQREVPAIQPKWDGRDVTETLEPYSTTPGVFHKLNMGRISAVCYLTCITFGSAYLEYIPEFHHNTLEVYNIRIGKGGIPVGFLFRSPLRLKCDPYYALFIKRKLNPITDIIQHPVSVEKRYVLQNGLVFHSHETGYLITRQENNGVTRMLNQ